MVVLFVAEAKSSDSEVGVGNGISSAEPDSTEADLVKDSNRSFGCS